MKRRTTAAAAAATAMLNVFCLLAPSAQAFVPEQVERMLGGPMMPLRAQPEFGDGFGAGRGHEGQDLFAPVGTSLVAVSDAIVLETGSDSGRGNYVSIYSPDLDRTFNYFHMRSPAIVRQGDQVRTGEKLGELGCTGSCWGDHLHFEVHIGRSPYERPIDPLPFLNTLRPAGSR